MRGKLLLSCASAAMLVLGTRALATPVVPGVTVFPSLLTPDAGATLLASLSEPAVSPAGTYSGTLTSAVFRDSTGMLEFDYQFANSANSTDAVNRLTATPFTGFFTDAGFYETPPSPFVTGTQVPVTVDRSISGDTVGFSFTPPVTGGVGPGQTSDVLVVRTNATQFTSGFIGLIDGGGATFNGFAPASAVPLPYSALGGLALLGGLAAFRIFGRKPAPTA